MSKRQSGHLISLAVGGLLAAAPVLAEPSPGPDATLEEVIVTSQKVARDLQDTPAAVTALSGADLVVTGVTDLRGAQMYVPQVRFQAQGNNTQVFVRGVGTGLDLPNIEPSVGFIVNGAYVPREASSAALFDVAQLEVLPGPQGTLYGRSAIGGTVGVTFNRPTQDSNGSILMEAGNYSFGHISYAQNLPVGEDFAARVAVDSNYREGYMASGADSRRDNGIRVSGLYTPGETVSLYAWAQYLSKGGHPANLVNKGFDPTTGEYSENAFLHDDPWNDTRTGALEPLAIFGQPQGDEQRYDTFMAGAELGWTLGQVRMTYLPAYLWLDSSPQYWLGGIRAQLNAHHNQLSQELRFANAEPGRVNWLAGVYSYELRNDGPFYLFTNQPFQFPQSDIRHNSISSLAAFGEATLSVTDTLRLTAGGRYSRDERDADGVAPPAVGTGPFEFSRTFSNLDWKLGAEYDLAPDMLLYAAVQTGYKPGTYNEVPSTPEFDNLVHESTLTAWTTGLKTRLADGALQVNTELYYYDYKDLQIQAYSVSAPFNPVFNAQKIEIYGAQVDVLWAVSANGLLSFNAAYSKAENKEFVAPDGSDYSGLAPPYAPEWTLLGGYSHAFALGAGTLRARVDGRYESRWWADYVQNPGVRQDGAFKADASLTYESPAGWQLGLWGKNLTNEAVLAATAAAGIPGPGTAYLEPPRTFGLRFTTGF